MSYQALPKLVYKKSGLRSSKHLEFELELLQSHQSVLKIPMWLWISGMREEIEVFYQLFNQQETHKLKVSEFILFTNIIFRRIRVMGLIPKVTSKRQAKKYLKTSVCLLGAVLQNVTWTPFSWPWWRPFCH